MPGSCLGRGVWQATGCLHLHFERESWAEDGELRSRREEEDQSLGGLPQAECAEGNEKGTDNLQRQLSHWTGCFPSICQTQNL